MAQQRRYHLALQPPDGRERTLLGSLHLRGGRHRFAGHTALLRDDIPRTQGLGIALSTTEDEKTHRPSPSSFLFLRAPQTPISPISNMQVLLQTNLGDITLRLYDETPQHRDNFVRLVREGYYNVTLFHRVMLQVA